ncbi:hypothetical protein [Parendozoicomonas sp. Alg238-R29]|uniref:hypothetical protein n=1 Tax=Parendozoicomonas sp. Alg238-R29 TaxID=2993446 RepID=UPI00248E1F0A|nr:hypothetical protein [Parendozoicomonas sp. Alg238-R29]
MPVKRVVILLCLCLLFRQGLLQAYDNPHEEVVTTPPRDYYHRYNKNSFLERFYIEGAHDSWLSWNANNGVQFENRHLQHHLSLSLAAAIGTALISNAPQLCSVVTNSWQVQLAASLPALILPVYYFKQHWKAFREKQTSKVYQIVIADNHSLAERLMITLHVSPNEQKLVFQHPPVRLFGFPLKKTKNNNLLYTLAYQMFLMNSDEVSLTWRGTHTSVEIKIGKPEDKGMNVYIPVWGATLSKIIKTQKVPSVMAFLQPRGLEFITSLFKCFLDFRFSPGKCECGELSFEASYSHGSHYYFKPDSHFKTLPPLNGKKINERFFVPFLPCNKETECEMAMTWSMAPDLGHTLLSEKTPMFIYSMPKKINTIPIRPPSSNSTVVTKIAAWQTDLMFMPLYLALYFSASVTFERIFRSMGWINSSLASGGSSAFVAWLIDAQYSLFGDTFHNLTQYYEDHYSSNAPPSKFFGFTVTQLHLLRETQTIKAIGANSITETLHEEKTTSEPTLSHMGNNCFFNATLSYLSHTLTNQELAELEDGVFTSANSSSEESDELAELRESFITLMRTLRQNSLKAVSQKVLKADQQRFFQAAQDYGQTEDGVHLGLILGSSSMWALQQHDAHEFLVGLFDALGMSHNKAASLIHGTKMEFSVEGNTYHKYHFGGDVKHSVKEGGLATIELAIPTPEHIDRHKIRSFNDILHKEYLHREWCPETEGVRISSTEAKEMNMPKGVYETIEATLLEREIFEIPPAEFENGKSTSRPLSYFKTIMLTPDNPEDLQHITTQVRLYSNSSAQTDKLRKVSRHLLAGGDKLIIPVYTQDMSSTSRKDIHMQLDSVVMHFGETIDSGHYLSADLREGRWYISDDMSSYVTRLDPAPGQEDRPPVDILNSYMEQHGYDLYILHFHRL